MKVLSIFFAIIGCAFTAPDVTRVNGHLNGRIVGGKPVNIQNYPYQLSLLCNGQHICGASIISTQWALTASHCIPPKLSWCTYTLASNSSIIGAYGAGTIIHQVVNMIRNPLINDYNLDGDVAVIQIADSFIRPDSIAKIVGLPSTTFPPATGALVTVTGWGEVKEKDPLRGSYQLLSVEIPIVNWSLCRNLYIPWKWPVTPRMLCAGWLQGGKASCQGDSGGPVVMNGVQVGIVSWAIGCARPGLPSVFADVTYLRQWINSATGGVV